VLASTAPQCEAALDAAQAALVIQPAAAPSASTG
jgi:hypothetical protein